MPSTTSLISRIIADYPDITFTEGDDFLWNPALQTIMYDPRDPHASEHLLHELGHAELAHADYQSDIGLIALERDAWHQARTVVAPRYQLHISADIIEDDLDTYRDWLHARSLCPHCQQNGLQSSQQEYTCLICQTKWRVNQAIGCALRRYIKKSAS